MTKIAERIKSGEIIAPDVLVGGTPCQSFSVAGLRGGLSDARGQLTQSFVELANEMDSSRFIRGLPESIIVWENVPGVLSSKDNAFGCFLAGIAGESCELQPPGGKWSNAGCVYGPQRSIAWRVLDAQYFGVAQRRRRVFLVASARNGFDPTKVLFEQEGERRDFAPIRSSRKETPRSANGCANAVMTFDKQSHSEYGVNPVASTIKARDYKMFTDLVCVHGTQDPLNNSDHAYPLGRNNGQENVIALAGNTIDRQPHNGGNGNGNGFDEQGVMYTLTRTDVHAVAFAQNQLGEVRTNKICGTLNTNSNASGRNAPLLFSRMRVRRLTPKECERLQGFPDDYTNVTFKGKPAADAHRYKALGNSMAVPCMKWIGKRIEAELNK
jgi:DNA (cytosine-5)-methyltransferase 1